MKIRFVRFAAAIVLLSGVVAGCGGDGFDRVKLSGTVACEGMESVNGNILATPSKPGTGAPNVSAPVTDGKFSFTANRGPVAASYIFEINLQDPGAAPVSGESPAGEVETGPEITYQKTIDVPKEGSDSFSINLTSADLVGDSERPASGEI